MSEVRPWLCTNEEVYHFHNRKADHFSRSTNDNRLAQVAANTAAARAPRIIPGVPLNPAPPVAVNKTPSNSGGGSSEDPLLHCFEQVTKFDMSICKIWKDEVEKLLVFGALFSAVVTAFTVESYKLLQDDPQDTTTAFLQYIAFHMPGTSSSNPSAPALPTISSNALSSPTSDPTIRINIFWFMSLSLSLMAVLLCILSMQWLREYEREDFLTPLNGLLSRQIRYEGLKRWHVTTILTLLPVLLQVSLILFLFGLVDLLWALNWTVALPVTVVAGFTVLILLATTILPTLQYLFTTDTRLRIAQCPYKSPQSWYFHKLFMTCHRVVLFQIELTNSITKSVRSFSPGSLARNQCMRLSNAVITVVNVFHCLTKQYLARRAGPAKGAPDLEGATVEERFPFEKVGKKEILRDFSLASNWSQIDAEWRRLRRATDDKPVANSRKDVRPQHDVINTFVWIGKTFLESERTLIATVWCLESYGAPVAVKVLEHMHRYDKLPDGSYRMDRFKHRSLSAQVETRNRMHRLRLLDLFPELPTQLDAADAVARSRARVLLIRNFSSALILDAYCIQSWTLLAAFAKRRAELYIRCMNTLAKWWPEHHIPLPDTFFKAEIIDQYTTRPSSTPVNNTILNQLFHCIMSRLESTESVPIPHQIDWDNAVELYLSLLDNVETKSHLASESCRMALHQYTQQLFDTLTSRALARNQHVYREYLIQCSNFVQNLVHRPKRSRNAAFNLMRSTWMVKLPEFFDTFKNLIREIHVAGTSLNNLSCFEIDSDSWGQILEFPEFGLLPQVMPQENDAAGPLVASITIPIPVPVATPAPIQLSIPFPIPVPFQASIPAVIPTDSAGSSTASPAPIQTPAPTTSISELLSTNQSQSSVQPTAIPGPSNLDAISFPTIHAVTRYFPAFMRFPS